MYLKLSTVSVHCLNWHINCIFIRWTCVQFLPAGCVWRRLPDCWSPQDSDRPRWSPDLQTEAGSDWPAQCDDPVHRDGFVRCWYSWCGLCVYRVSTHLGGGDDPLLQEVGWGRRLMDGRRWTIGQDGGGGRQSWRRRAADWINSAHDQLTPSGEIELTAGIRRHTVQLKRGGGHLHSVKHVIKYKIFQSGRIHLKLNPRFRLHDTRVPERF